jgi:hypothetical protein
VEGITARELAEIYWEGTAKWPRDEVDWENQLRADTKLAPEDFRNEMIYLLSFATDFVLHNAFKDNPRFRDAVRDAHLGHLGKFAREHACRPMPVVQWFRGRIYHGSGKYPDGFKDPILSINDRFQLYVDALNRGAKAQDSRSIGESLAYAFAGLCGTRNMFFITGVSVFLSETMAGLMKQAATFQLYEDAHGNVVMTLHKTTDG